MPELPEVEVLVRHLDPLLRGRFIRSVEVHRVRCIRPDTEDQFINALTGGRILAVRRRAKYLVFDLEPSRPAASPAASSNPRHVLGHLGMTGRMYLQSVKDPLPKHAVASLILGGERFVFEDVRGFGRLSTDLSPLNRLGPEPFHEAFSAEYFFDALKRSRQSVKVKLLDQALVAGVGNIYASEALHRAGVSPRKRCDRLARRQVAALRLALIEVMNEAIACGSTIPLDFAGTGRRDGLFYYGGNSDGANSDQERFRVYDRAGESCPDCAAPIKRIVQAARSTFYCPRCQR